MRVAIFDFDGTVYKDETFQLLMDHLKHHPTYRQNYKSFYRKLAVVYIGYKLKVVPEAAMKARAMQYYIHSFGPLSKESMDTYFFEIFEKMDGKFNDKVLDALKNHQAEGDYTILVSGAFMPLLKFVKEKFNFNDVIGTDVPMKGNVLDPKQKIEHIQGAQKKIKVLEKFEEQNVNWTESYSYGDSFSDLEILELVGNPVAVNPDERLKAIAETKKWRVI